MKVVYARIAGWIGLLVILSVPVGCNLSDQELHILLNQNDATLSTRYQLNEMQLTISTPEWIFGRADLYRFAN